MVPSLRRDSSSKRPLGSRRVWIRKEQFWLRRATDDPFVVVVTTDDEAEDVWPDFERMRGVDSFDARRANVGVFSDDGCPNVIVNGSSRRSSRSRIGATRS
jgi:hypothetical protein